MYLEILKGRETGIGHSSVFDLNGNTGKAFCAKKNRTIEILGKNVRNRN